MNLEKILISGIIAHVILLILFAVFLIPYQYEISNQLPDPAEPLRKEIQNLEYFLKQKGKWPVASKDVQIGKSGGEYAILTAHNKHYNILAQLTEPNQRQYALYHNYSYFINPTLKPENIVLENYKEVWKKILLMRQFLMEPPPNVKWLMWIDTDVIFVNYQTTLESLTLAAGPNAHLVLGGDYVGINAGVFLLRVSDWSKKLLDTVLSKFERFSTHTFQEQESLQDTVRDPEFKDETYQFLRKMTFNLM